MGDATQARTPRVRNTSTGYAHHTHMHRSTRYRILTEISPFIMSKLLPSGCNSSMYPWTHTKSECMRMCVCVHYATSSAVRPSAYRSFRNPSRILCANASIHLHVCLHLMTRSSKFHTSEHKGVLKILLFLTHAYTDTQKHSDALGPADGECMSLTNVCTLTCSSWAIRKPLGAMPLITARRKPCLSSS
jgi:hypothetical protein